VGALIKKIDGSVLSPTELGDTEFGLGKDIPGSVCSTLAFFDSVVPDPDSPRS